MSPFRMAVESSPTCNGLRPLPSLTKGRRRKQLVKDTAIAIAREDARVDQDGANP
jgi:hypothetical protein